jgi:succinate--hydroxymethylglutarate CoA-transferase
MRKQIEHPAGGTIDTLGFPVKYDGITPSIRSHPPALGEHSEEIFSSLGYSHEEIESFRENGIISTPDT